MLLTILNGASSAADTLVVGWQHGADDFNPRAPARFQTAASLALTPATLPPLIRGMAWFEPPPPDQDYSRKTFGFPSAVALTPSTLPPVISGMAWRQPLDELPPRRLGKSEPSPIGIIPAIAQRGWGFINAVDDQPKKRYFSDVPAIALTPATLPPQIAGMAWFTTTDVYQPRRWFVNDPSQVPYAPDTITWSFFSSDTVLLPDPPTDRPPAFGTTPPAQAVGISGMAWFEPPDRNKPAVKINGESQPAIALTPATLPPQISGMAWFEPPDFLPYPAPKPHWGAAGVLIPAVAPTPISGISWFEPPDRNRPATKVTVESLPAIALTLPSAVASISGMAWFQPPDRDRPAVKINVECPPAISLTPTTLPPRISGMSWFVPTDRQRPSLTVTIESLPAYNPTGAFLPTPPLVTEVHNFPFIANVGTMMQRW